MRKLFLFLAAAGCAYQDDDGWDAVDKACADSPWTPEGIGNIKPKAHERWEDGVLDQLRAWVERERGTPHGRCARPGPSPMASPHARASRRGPSAKPGDPTAFREAA